MTVDMNTILGLGQDVVYKGKTYRIADDLDFCVEADFTRWLKSQAMQSAIEVSGGDQDEADRYRRIFFEESLAGAYRLGGVRARQALLGNPEASVKLLHLLLEDGRRKAPGKKTPDVSEALAREMLRDEKVGPWVQAMCLVALGLDPTNALVMGMGLVMTRAEQNANQYKTATTVEMMAELNSRPSESSSETILPFISNYLDSLGGNSSSSTATAKTG